MIEAALIKFKEVLSSVKVGGENQYKERDVSFLVELARKQLGDSFLGGLILVSLNSRHKYSPESSDAFLRQRLDKVLEKVELKYTNIPVPFNAQDKAVWCEAFKIDDVDFLRWTFKKGVVNYRYTLSKKHIMTLVECLLSDNAIVTPDNKHSLPPLKSLIKFRNTQDILQAIPELPKKVIAKLGVGMVNFKELKDSVGTLAVESLASESFKTTIHFFQGVSIINKLYRQVLTPTKDGGIYSYPLAYYITGSNHPRLTDRVGVQQSRNKLLVSMFEGVTFCNQDNVSSGVNMLEKLMRDAGINVDWLVTYLKAPKKYRKILMDKVGVEKESIKAALQAVTNGGVFSNSSSGAVYKAFDDEDHNHPLTIKRVGAFLEGVKELKKPMKELGDVLMDLEKCKQLGWCFRGKLKNAIGQHYDVVEEQKRGNEKRKKAKERKVAAQAALDAGGLTDAKKKYFEKLLTDKLPSKQGRVGQRLSFMVTGMEQSFILRLIELLPPENPVYVLKHDGFISKLPVEQGLIDQATSECDLPYLKFEEEPFK